ncbi:DoxX family protein [Flavihumibacter petaseus]|uniref:DoxX family protein n=1 Tax=Flavihumibacter petaseus NBRC 106054 TaxID=1220578 RepID=A0A0E9N357_9BACT|nr:DoxX family protein [Flavihumibacter petaseus]GAO44392.1 hypothetical protein FPE01S_03_04300 [Flavihumibacter petaseus NBRC 106054]
MKLRILSWVLRIVAAVILLQTLYFKFTGQPESVTLFTQLGMEPWGRIGTGIAELITAVLLLVPATCFYGALAGMALMAGAIFFHLTKLGIYFGGDALLFTYAVTVFAACVIICILERKKIR